MPTSFKERLTFFAVLAALCAATVGCDSKSADDAATASSAATPASSSGGVAPVGSGAAGAMAPVSGAEEVGGGTGGGVAQSAKDMARGAAAKASAPSMPSETGE